MHQRFYVPKTVPGKPSRFDFQLSGGFPVVPLKSPARGRGRKRISGSELILIEPAHMIHFRQRLESTRVLGLLQIRIDQVIDGVELVERASTAMQPLALGNG